MRSTGSVYIAALLALGCTQPRAPGAPGPVSRDAAETRFVDSVLAGLTLDEKFGQLNQVSGSFVTGPGGSNVRIDQIKRGEIGSMLNVMGADSTRALQRVAVEQTRARIPIVFAMDVIHGFRTIFPVPLGEAASWNPESAERAARIAAIESSANGLHWTFAPMVDIARDARWGRVVEGAGEDPYLGVAFATARVRGFQGSSIRDVNSIAATAKHFAAYGAAEGGRDYDIADIPERTLRETHLPPFRAAACANVATFMSSFNEIGGVPAHASPHLTTGILRREWGFDGMVVSDWTGVAELLNHGIGANAGEVGKLAIESGVDMDMVSEIYLKSLPALVRSGQLSPATVDDAVRRVLRLKYRLGLFADPYRSSDANRERTMTLTAEHRAAAREGARQAIVLLKNDNRTLPLARTLGRLLVVGALAPDSAAALGNWAGAGRKEDAISVLTGIRRAVSSGTTVQYVAGAGPTSSDSSGIAEAVNAARTADAVVLVIGETPDMSAEAASRASIELPGAQLRLTQAVRAGVRTGTPVVAVLMNGRPLAVQWLHDNVPAIVETWYGGIEHGTATADVLFGDFNPGGKLPATFPRVTGQAPIYYAHKNTGRPPQAENKYSSKYLDVPIGPLYPFGHGLSFTTFTFGAPRLSATTMGPSETPRLSATTMGPSETLHLEVDVTNSGTMAGDEVVQLYIRDEVATITRPVKELRGFRRLTLEPGERTTVRFDLTPWHLSMYDASLRRVVEPGWFSVFVGNSSTAPVAGRIEFRTSDGRPASVVDGCPVR